MIMKFLAIVIGAPTMQEHIEGPPPWRAILRPRPAGGCFLIQPEKFESGQREVTGKGQHAAPARRAPPGPKDKGADQLFGQLSP